MGNVIQEILIFLVIFVALLLCSAFFSASETALISVNKIRLFHGVREGKRRSKAAYDLVLNLDKLITTVLICNNLVNTAMAAIGTLLCIRIFGEEWGILIATLIVTVLLLVFGEISPKIFAASNADKVSLNVAFPMTVIIKILHPIVIFFTQLGHRIVKLFGGDSKARGPLITEDEMRFMIEAGKEEGIYGDQERKMLHRIFNFGDLRVDDVMIPLKDVAAVPVTATENDLFSVCVEEGHSRVPVYQEDMKNIVGIIYAKDILHLLLNDQLIKIADILHEPYFVAPDMRVTQLLKEFLKSKLHVGVVGSAGQALGIVTLEDLVEEIVGEIEEEPKKEIATSN